MNLTKTERAIVIIYSVTISALTTMLIIFYYSASWLFESVDVFFMFFIILSAVFIILIIKPKTFSPKVVDIELHKDRINQDFKKAEINPIGNMVTMIEEIGYADLVYALKPHRESYSREKGKIVLTDKELIFLGKKEISFSILLSEIEAIQPFNSREGNTEFKLFEIIYNKQQQKASAVFMGLPGFSFDFFTVIELKSLKLMELIQKWYDSWKNK